MHEQSNITGGGGGGRERKGGGIEFNGGWLGGHLCRFFICIIDKAMSPNDHTNNIHYTKSIATSLFIFWPEVMGDAIGGTLVQFSAVG